MRPYFTHVVPYEKDAGKWGRGDTENTKDPRVAPAPRPRVSSNTTPGYYRVGLKPLSLLWGYSPWVGAIGLSF